MITITSLVGVFSSYAKQLQQVWKLLQSSDASRASIEVRSTPRSLPRITPAKLKLMIADYESGMTAYELAEKYGHNRGTIMKHLTQAGVRSRVAVPTGDEITHWRELHAQGLGFKTIARRVGRNHKTVRKYIPQ